MFRSRLQQIKQGNTRLHLLSFWLSLAIVLATLLPFSFLPDALYSQDVDPFIAYVRNAFCPTNDEGPACELQIASFVPSTGMEAVYSLPGVSIEPSSLQRLGSEAVVFQYVPSLTSGVVAARFDLEDQQLETFDLVDSDTGLTALSLSPDGKQLAYSVQTADHPQAHDLTLFNLETGESQVVLGGYWTLSQPSFAPDGNRLAVAVAPLNSDPLAPPFDVHVLDLMTGNFTNLTPDEHNSGGEAWSSDGSRLAFVMSDTETNETVIAVATVDHGDVEIFEPWQTSLWHPLWSMDDRTIIYGESLQSSARLWRLDLASGERQLLIEKRQITASAVSPDGTQLAYAGWIQRSDGPMLCIYDLLRSVDTCYEDVQPDQNATLDWRS